MAAPNDAVAEVLAALADGTADVSYRLLRRYLVTPADADEPAVFITLDDDGSPIYEDATIVFGIEHALGTLDADALANAIGAFEARRDRPRR